MAFTFTPSTIAMPSPPSYAAPQTPAVSSNPLTTLGELANINLTQQQLKKAQATFSSDVSKAQADAATAQIGVGKAETEAAKAKQNYNNELRDSMLKVAGPYVSDERALKAAQLAPNASPEDVKKAKDDVLEMNYEIRQQLKASGMSNTDIAQHMNYLDDLAVKTPQLYAKALNKGIQTLAGPSNIAQQNQPTFTTNAASQFVRATPSTGTIEPIKGQAYNPNPSSADIGMTNRQAEAYSSDFSNAQKDATEATPRIALFQNIKKLAPEAFTGVGGARKELATGVANAIGIDIYTAEKTATDELAKNSALLSMVGGNTDAARLLAEAANPNKKMNEQAIKDVADQLIGVERMKQAKARFLTPYANDPQKYAQALNTFNELNDFRIFQEATPAQVARLKSSMSKDQQAEMSRKIKRARELGLIQ
jgi:hypothetical protein